MIRKTKLRRGKPPKKKSSRRKAMQELDLLVKAKILERDGHQCVRCGATQNLQSAHVFPKGTHPRMRFMELNLLTLCLKDHLFFAHKDPLGFAAWFNEKYPGRYEELLIWSRQMPKIDLKELRISLGIFDSPI
jgi:5-methylcytosine-specific restriction endonuclease McrA